MAMRLALSIAVLTSTAHGAAVLDALAADDACEPGSNDCAVELLQHRSAKRTQQSVGGAALQASESDDAVVPVKPLAKELVHAVYTYGAPATRTTPFHNHASADGCFKGLRSYTEDLLFGVGGPIHQVDAASMFNYLPHMWIDSVVLRWQKESIFTPCNTSLHGHPDWPKRGAQVYDEWRLHKEPNYRDRLAHLELYKKGVGLLDASEKEPFKTAQKLTFLAWRVYEDLALARRLTKAEHPEWRLVGYIKMDDGDDSDPLALVQDTGSLDCMVVFTGTNSFSEMFTSTTQYTTGFCGWPNVHVGYRNEVWTLTGKLWAQNIKPKLAKCRKVSCVGHSLGGSLCEVFSACANSGHVNDPDYKRLAWEQGTPELMPEDRWFDG